MPDDDCFDAVAAHSPFSWFAEPAAWILRGAFTLACSFLLAVSGLTASQAQAQPETPTGLDMERETPLGAEYNGKDLQLDCWRTAAFDQSQEYPPAYLLVLEDSMTKCYARIDVAFGMLASFETKTPTAPITGACLEAIYKAPRKEVAANIYKLTTVLDETLLRKSDAAGIFLSTVREYYPASQCGP